MFDTQFRTLGTGETIVWRKVFWKFGYTVEVLDNRMYEVEDELNKCVSKMQGLFKKHDVLYDEVIAARQQITDSREDSPYHGSFHDIQIGKDSSKYRRKRTKPHNLWESVRNAVIAARSFVVIPVVAVATGDYCSELTSSLDQPIGEPAKNKQSKKDQRRQQN